MMSRFIKGSSFFIFIACFSVAMVVFGQEPKQRHAPNTLPGVEPEMLTADYWIALQKDVDRVIMTPDEIVRFNDIIRNKRVVFGDYYGRPNPLQKPIQKLMGDNLLMNPIEPLDLPDTAPGDSLRAWLQSTIEILFHPDNLWGSQEFYDDRNVIYTDAMKQALVDDMDIDRIPNSIRRQFGIIVNRADLRYYPTPAPGFSSVSSRVDRFQGGALYTGMPVAVLHRSADTSYLYVQSPVSRGWVAAQDIALGSREELRSLVGDKNFLMATAEKVPVYGDPSYENFTTHLYFSATMPLLKHDRNGYVVKMPYRRPDGSCGVASGYVRPDADVNIGYLPYTKRNVLVQIFKLLNQPYGWEDQYKKRDCSGTMWVLLRCFGIQTGRVPRYILNSSDNQVFINPALSSEEKTAIVEKIEPVITMAGNSGHIVLYLGKARNGKLYFIHQAGWGYKDENGENLIVNSVSVSAADHSFYSINSPNVFTTFDNKKTLRKENP